MQAIFFSATIIIAGFLPLFTLSGVEGHIFGPMAKTYAYALSGGLLATFTVSPPLAAVLLPDKVSETETIIVRGLRHFYRRVVALVLARRGVTSPPGSPSWRRPCWRPAPWAGVPAQARGGQHLAARGIAAVGVARRRQRLRQSHAPPGQELLRGRDGDHPARAGPTTAPIPTVSPTSSSSCR